MFKTARDQCFRVSKNYYPAIITLMWVLIETHVFGIVLGGHNLVSRHKIVVVFISHVSGVVSLSFTISVIDMCLLYPFVSLVLFFSPCGNDKS